MKRIVAFVLCWVMLLSQMAMVAEATLMQEQSDIIYLEENGIVVEDGGQVIMDTPLGRSESTDRYSPSVPKFVPESLKNLGLISLEKDEIESSTEESGRHRVEWETYTATFNKDKVMFYSYAGNDAESIYVNGLLGDETELIYTGDPTWYQLDDSYQAGYTYVKAEDVTLVDKIVYRGAMLIDSDVVIRIEDAPTASKMRRMNIDKRSIPHYRFDSADIGVRTHLGTYSIGVRTRDGYEWEPSEPVGVCITLNELPELSDLGVYYVECVNADGTVSIIPAYRCWQSNMLTFEATEFSALSVYSLDYPEGTMVKFPPVGREEFFSTIFNSLNAGYSLEDVVDITFENPDTVKVEPFYNEYLGVQDWKITTVKDEFVAQKFTIHYEMTEEETTEESPEQRYTDSYGSDGYYHRDEPLTSMANNRWYNIDKNTTCSAMNTYGKNRIRLGKIQNSGNSAGIDVTLTMNGGVNINNSGEGLIIGTNTLCSGTFLRGVNNTSFLFKSTEGGTFTAWGGGKQDLLKIHGNRDNMSSVATQALLVIEKGVDHDIGDAWFLSAENSGGGGAIRLNGGTLTLSFAYINNCKALNGGGICVTAGTLITKEGLKNTSSIGTRAWYDFIIEGCTATQYGGALYVEGGAVQISKGVDPGDPNSSTTISKTGAAYFKGNHADDSGGAIYIKGGSIELVGTVNLYVQNNTTGGNGGGITVSGTGTLTLGEVTTVSDNEASSHGGGMYVVSNSTININKKITFSSNHADKSGGGLCTNSSENNKCVINFKVRSSFNDNSAKNGGGFYNGGNGTINSSGGLSLRTNSATETGGAIVNHGTITLEDPLYVGSWSDNAKQGGNTATNGAGIYQAGGNFYIKDGLQMGQNIASGNGGGICIIGGNMEVNGSNSGNRADIGAYYYNGSTPAQVEGNQAKLGAGVYQSGGKLTFTGDLNMAGNDAKTKSGNGGAIYQNGGTMTLSATTTIGPYTWTNGTTSATFGGNKAVNGGGVYVAAGTVTCSGTTTVDKNTVTTNGGGVVVTGGEFVVNAAVAVNRNTAGSHGGGMHFEGGTLTVNETMNLKVGGDTGGSRNYAKWGAGIYVKGTVAFGGKGKMYVRWNEASQNGGGIQIETGTLTVNDPLYVYVGYNKAKGVDKATEKTAGYGGGINLYNNAKLVEKTTKAFQIYGNTADTYGGGIYCMGIVETNGMVIGLYESDTFKGNTAKWGGGLYIANQEGKTASSFKATGVVKMEHNTATDTNGSGYGGGMYVASGTVELSKANIGTNYAIRGGGVYIAGGELKLTNESVIQNHQYTTNEKTTETTYGAGIYMTDGKVTLDKSYVKNNKTGDNACGICLNGSSTSQTVILQNGSEVSGNAATGQGGGVWVKNGTVTVNNSTIKSNTATTSGGGIYISTGATVNLQNGANVESNTGPTYGGGIYMTSTAKLNTSGTVSISSNTCSLGSGIYLDNGTITVSSGTTDICSNTSSGHGGGINSKNGTITVNGTLNLGASGKPNTATHGAGMLVGEQGTVTVNGEGTFHVAYNEASSNGGGIQVENATLNFSDSVNVEVDHNKATGGYGGGIVVNLYNSTATPTLAETTSGTFNVHDNEAKTAAGGIYVDGVFTSNGGLSVYGNKAGTYGGGIFVDKDGYTGGTDKGSTVTLKGGAIYDNTATENGGGIYNKGTFSSDTKRLYVGASAADQNGNTAKNGAGLYQASGSFTVSGDSTEGWGLRMGKNIADADGGGMYIAAGTVSLGTGEHYIGSVGSDDTKIAGNQAVNGAGVYINNGSLSCTGTVKIRENLAGSNGGGIYTKVSLSLDSNEEISSNKAGVTSTGAVSSTGGCGGGVYIVAGTLTMNGGTISKNEAHAKATKNSGTGFGGGIYVHTDATANLSGCTISGNKASVTDSSLSQTALGGGIHTKGIVNFKGDVTISGNTTSRFGGGFYQAGGTTTIDSGKTVKINGTNKADRRGGGLVVNNGTFTVKGTLNVHNNQGVDGGGGICMDDKGTINGTGAINIYSNSVTGSDGYGGGGLCIYGNSKFEPMGTVQIYSNTASNSKGGGIYTEATWTLKSNIKVGIEKGKENSAKYGGGIYVNGGTLTFGNNAILQYNSATIGGGMYIAKGTVLSTGDENSAIVQHNSASNFGGGIYLHSTDSKLEWKDGAWWRVRFNHSNNKGGGIYVLNGHITCNSENQLNIYGNTADYGAGMYLGGKGEGNGDPAEKDVYFDGDGPNGLDLFVNIAVRNGGGIMAECCNWRAGLPMEISHNEAQDQDDGDHGYGGGIYLGAWGVKSTFTFSKNVKICGNIAVANGGGMYIAGNSDTTVEFASGVEMKILYDKTSDTSCDEANNLVKAGNSAANGGGIAMTGGTLIIKGGTHVDNNIATTGNGGGLYLTGGVVEADGARLWVEGNKATAGNGGGVYITGSSTILSTSDVTVDGKTQGGAVTITKGNEAKLGGGIYLASGKINYHGSGTCYLGGFGTDVGNKATEKGGGAYLAGGTFSVKSPLRVAYNEATSGGGFYVNNGTFTYEGSSLIVGTYTYGEEKTVTNGNTATSGGGAYIEKGTFTAKSATFDTNYATDGGGVYMTAGTLTLEGSTIKNHSKKKAADTTTTMNKGGGIYITGGTVSVKGTSNIIGNETKSHGAGIYATNGTISIASGGTLNIGASGSPNKGSHGAGMMVCGGGTVTVNNAGTESGTRIFRVRYNEANSNGGGIQVENATLEFTGSVKVEVDHNKAKSGYGGGIAVNLYQSTVAPTLIETTSGDFEVHYNEATSLGGGIYVDGIFSSDGGLKVYQNTAGTSGGGIYVDKGTNADNYYTGGADGGSEVTLNGGNIYENKATANHGGGIYTKGTLNFAGGTTTIYDNKAPASGSRGGGIAVTGGTVNVTSRCDINTNTAENGGGLYVTVGTVNYNARSYIEGNKAVLEGGGIYITSSGTINTTGISLKKNTAGTHGGGIFNSGTFVATGNTIWIGSWNSADADSGNKAGVKPDGTANTSGNGGGLYLNSGTFSVNCDASYKDGLRMFHNKAANGNGGAIFINGGTLTMGTGYHYIGGDASASGKHVYDNNTMAGNEAKNGGGIYLYNTGVLTMTGNVYINNNTATVGYGGGMRINNHTSTTTNKPSFSSSGTLHVNNNTALKEDANLCGGGIYVTNAALFSISGTGNVIRGNVAEYQGGGVYATQTTVSISNCEISGNTAQESHAGGIIILGATDTSAYSATLTDCKINGNICLNENQNIVDDDDRGAGIYAQSLALTISGGEIKDNSTPYGRGGGIYFNTPGKELNISNCTISGNKALKGTSTTADRGNGGGIYINQGSGMISGCTINGNKADADGGGIYTKEGMTITNTTIGASGEANTAGQNGGGIYCDKQKTITMSGTSSKPTYIQYNTATAGSGGGLYLSTATLNTSGTINIHYNTATAGDGGGLYLSSTMTDTGMLSGTMTNTGTLNVYGNKAEKGHGGGLYVNGTVTTKGGKIGGTAEGQGNKAKFGGGIYIIGENSVFNSYGGGITVQKNHASSYGGGVYLHSGTLKWQTNTESTTAEHGNWTVKNNTATSKGGGVYIHTGTVWCEDSWQLNIGGNSANYGGGMYLGGQGETNGSDETLKTIHFVQKSTGGLDVYNNTAYVNGGGIMAECCNWTIDTPMYVTNNFAKDDDTTGENGGGIYFGAWAVGLSCNINANMYVYSNEATGNGGGFYINRGEDDPEVTVTIASGVQVDIIKKSYDSRDALPNSAANGGGIYVARGVLINNGVLLNVESNKATTGNGGGIYLSKDASFTPGTLTVYSNEAAGNGGGIFTASALSLTTATIGAEDKGNTAGGSGGGIFSSGASLTLNTGVTVEHNTAAKHGGGVFADNYSTESLPSIKVGNNVKFNDNTATKNNGGGLYIRNFNVTMGSGVEIKNNTAGGSGGGALFHRDPNKGETKYLVPTVTLNGDSPASANITVQGNTSGGIGGGLYVRGCQLTASYLNVQSNIAGNNGGGMVVYCYQKVNENGNKGTDYDNLTLSEMKCTITNSTFNDNSTAGGGGGLYIEGYQHPDTSLAGSKFTGNAAEKNGGGIYVNTLSLKLDSTNSVSGNYAGAKATRALTASASETGGNGGGIFFTGSGQTLTLDQAEIYSNHAYNGTGTDDNGKDYTNGNGGGVYMAAGTTLKVIGNSNPTTAGVESSRIIGNHAANNGGGLYVVGGTKSTAASKIDIATGIPTKVGNKDHEVNLMVGDDNAASGNHAVNGGGIYISGGYVTLTGAHELFVRQNVATADGGGMVLDGTNLTISGIATVVSANTATANGGGIALINSAKMKETSNERFNIFGNTAGGNGGGIWCAGEIETNGMRIGYMIASEKNYAPNRAVDGGGLYLESGSFKATGNVWVANNEASGNGGGIYTKATLTMQSFMKVGYLDGTVECGNVAGKDKSGAVTGGDGGGIYIASGGSATMSSGSVSCNKAYSSGVNSGNGGGIYVAGTLNVDGGSISANHTYAADVKNGGGFGGGVYVAKNATANLKGGSISGNKANLTGTTKYEQSALGGGVFTNGTVNVTGNFTISGNYTPRYGGGYYQDDASSKTTISSGQTLTINGKNNAEQFGGGMVINDGTVEVKGTLDVSGNVAGVIATANGTETVTGGGGGGICMDNSCTVTGSGIIKITDNKTGGNGGGMYFSGNGVKSFAPTGKVTISRNTAGSNGGGIFITAGKYITAENGEQKESTEIALTGAELIGNTAGQDGGGVYIYASAVAKVTFTNTAIKENSAKRESSTKGNGGGIRMDSGDVTLDGTTVVENNYAMYGGGLYVRGGTLELTAEVVVQNHQKRAADKETRGSTGGGLWMEGGTVNVNGATFTKNYVSGDGGGIRLKKGTLNLKNAKVQRNQAGGNGGGIFVTGGTLTATDTTLIDSNTASADGGGIYLSNSDNEASATLTNVTIQKNEAVAYENSKGEIVGGNGGGIFMTKAVATTELTLTLGGSVTIKENTANGDGGGIRYGGGSITIQENSSPSIYDNTAYYGGGIFASAELTLNGNLTIGHATDSTLGNEAINGEGGGIYTSKTLTLTGVKIYRNTAKGHGGGIFAKLADETQTLTLGTGTELSYNKANPNSKGENRHGGGLYAYNYTVHVEAGVLIEGNTASSNGGGIYAYLSDVTLNEGVKVSGNTATNTGGGVFMYRQDGVTTEYTLTMTGTEEKPILIDNNTATNRGGGVHVEDCKVVADWVEVTKNMAKSHGGGMDLITANATISNGEISGNYAGKTRDDKVTGGNGGGIYATGNTQLKVTGTTISQNYAYINGSVGGRGGGIYVSSASLEMIGATVSKNHADSMGGGICTTLSPVTLTSVAVEENTAQNGGGMRLHEETATLEDCTITGNKATTETEGAACYGGGLYLYLTEATITGGSLSNNYAKKSGGGICVSVSEESTTTTKLTVISTDGKSPIRDNTADVSANDIYADGHHTQLIMSATTVDGTESGAAEYWFADYPTPNTEKGENLTIPNVFFSDYVNANGELMNLGRYNENTTPVTYARRSFGGTSTEPGAADASTAYLALTLGTAEHLFMDLTLTKKIDKGAVEDSTFIFYIKGLDDASFLLPVAINIAEDATTGSVTLTDLPVGFYDICEAEGWSWRYDPSTAVYMENGTATSAELANTEGDDSIRVSVSAATGNTATSEVTFTNTLDSTLWLTDAEYLPFLPATTGVSLVSADDEDEEDNE